MNDAKITLKNAKKIKKVLKYLIFVESVVYLSQFDLVELKTLVLINFFVPFISNFQAKVNVIN